MTTLQRCPMAVTPKACSNLEKSITGSCMETDLPEKCSRAAK